MTGLLRLKYKLFRALHSVSLTVLAVQRTAVEWESSVSFAASRLRCLLTHTLGRGEVHVYFRTHTTSRGLDTVARSHTPTIYFHTYNIDVYYFQHASLHTYSTLSIYYMMFNNFHNFSNLSLHNAFVKISAKSSFESILIITISFSFTLLWT